MLSGSAARMSHVQTSGNDVVLLVHGTYAARESDEGDSWWQRGSDAWRGLSERLPHGVDLKTQGRLFHWSGENSERARSKAAAQLLEHLRPLEESGQSYHLVGHSHGGSVIWNALKLKTLSGESVRLCWIDRFIPKALQMCGRI